MVETELEMVKIRTFKGRIFTLKVIEKTDSHIIGKDKYNLDVILPLSEVDSMIPFKGDS